MVACVEEIWPLHGQPVRLSSKSVIYMCFDFSLTEIQGFFSLLSLSLLVLDLMLCVLVCSHLLCTEPVAFRDGLIQPADV